MINVCCCWCFWVVDFLLLFEICVWCFLIFVFVLRIEVESFVNVVFILKFLLGKEVICFDGIGVWWIVGDWGDVVWGVGLWLWVLKWVVELLYVGGFCGVVVGIFCFLFFESKWRSGGDFFCGCCDGVERRGVGCEDVCFNGWYGWGRSSGGYFCIY